MHTYLYTLNENYYLYLYSTEKEKTGEKKSLSFRFIHEYVFSWSSTQPARFFFIVLTSICSEENYCIFMSYKVKLSTTMPFP